MTPTEATQFLEEHQIKFVLAQFVDMHGTAKTKAVPISHFEDILCPGAGFAGVCRLGFGNAAQQSRFYGSGGFVNAVDRALDARIRPDCLRRPCSRRTLRL